MARTTRKEKKRIVKQHKQRRLAGVDNAILPPVSYKVVASGTNEIRPVFTPPKKKMDLPIQSILTILMVAILTPLIAGGSIGLAADYAGEDMVWSSPSDVNGYSWAGGTQGDCVTTTSSGAPTTSNAVGSGTVTVGLHDYTILANPYLNGTSGSTICGGVDASNDFRLVLPSNAFIRNESHSRFMFEFQASSGCTSSCTNGSYDDGFTFDWFIFINGSKIFGQTDNVEKGYTWVAGTQIRSNWNMNYTLNVVDFNKLQTAIGECENTCSYVLHFDNVVQGSGTDADYSAAPWETIGHYRIETYALDDFSASMVMKVTPIVLGLAFGLVALASTSYWNPVFKNISTNLRKEGGLY